MTPEDREPLGVPAAAELEAGARERIGRILEGKYELVRVLGVGGMGEVYEAKHRQIGRRVAIKLLRPQFAGRADLVARFRNEARIAGSLEHENIATVYDVGVTPEGAPFLIMEYLEGIDCARALAADKTLAVARAANLLTQVCRGLALAHANGVVHRDLKPANVFLCRRPDGSELAKILDFGVAKLRTVDASEATITDVPVGTPHYMSPEQVRSDADIDARTDVYAVGVMLYELLSGQKPYTGNSALQIAHHILTQVPLPLRTLRPDLAEDLCLTVERAMAREREQRFESISALEATLVPWVETARLTVESRGNPEPSSLLEPAIPVETVPPTHVAVPAPQDPSTRLGQPNARVPRWGPRLIGAGLVLALLGALVWSLRGGSDAPTARAPAQRLALATLFEHSFVWSNTPRPVPDPLPAEKPAQSKAPPPNRAAAQAPARGRRPTDSADPAEKPRASSTAPAGSAAPTPSVRPAAVPSHQQLRIDPDNPYP